MRYTFDPAKDEANRAKHGVSLVLAEVLFAGPVVIRADDRFDYGELREVAAGLINDRAFVCVFTDFEDEIEGEDNGKPRIEIWRRVISLRRATAKERRDYDREIERGG